MASKYITKTLYLVVVSEKFLDNIMNLYFSFSSGTILQYQHAKIIFLV